MIYNERQLKELLPREISTLKLFDEIDSTSSAARRYAADGGGVDTALFLADSQSGGRGRMGRSFYSPSGAGIYMSLLLPVSKDASDTVLLTCAAAVAVRRAILAVTGTDTAIKWVNDLYCGERKVCGILCELLSEPRAVIIGVGVNLYPSELPSEISDVAGALLNAPSGGVTREALAAAIAKELLNVRRELSSGAFMNEYRENSAVLGKEIRYIRDGISQVGLATHINEYGHLYVLDEHGRTQILSSGEISVRFK